MTIIEKNVSELIPYDKNPRNNDNAVNAVAASIKEFGFKVPIVLDKNNVIVAGHTRHKAALKLGLEKVPCVIADDLTDAQIKAYRLADNKVGELADWNDELQLLELTELNALGVDMLKFGFEELKQQLELDETYTNAINIPQYDIKGETPDLSECVDTSKTEELIQEIDSSDLSKQEKEFLKLAANRHNVFNYRKIAEYYAAASEEVQRLMEKSALVIIDYNDAIANGYTKLKSELEEMRMNDE